MPPKKQSDEQLPPPIKRKTYPKNAKKVKPIQPEGEQEIVEPEIKQKVPNKKSTKKVSESGTVYDKIEKARNKKVDDFEPESDTDSEYDNSDDENVKFQIVQTMEPHPEPEPEPEPKPEPEPVKSRKSGNKKNTTKSTKPTAKYDPQVHFKQEQEKLKSLYDNQFKLLKEENNKLRNLNDYQTHLQRLTHMSRNVKIKF